MSTSLMNTYARFPIAFTHGAGAWIWDENNQPYLDALGGIAVCILGHAHPAVTAAIIQQSQQLLHTSNLFQIPLQEKLAAQLTQISAMERVFFCNSGAEAVEAALKIARLHARAQKIDLPQVIVMENSFHGRTFATLAATGNPKVQAGFEPLLPGFIRVPFNNIPALNALSQTHRDIVAILVEPIQGEGGINLPNPGYLHQIRQICDQNGWLMILDEIQSGLGRTGKWFAYQHEDGVIPDVMCLAKGLANGVPIGACLARGPAAHLFTPGKHGSTFGGNLLACAAALAVLKVIEEENLLARAESLGIWMLEKFTAALSHLQGIIEIRGKGLMFGIELNIPCREIVNQALAEGIIINVTQDKVIRLLPPLILSDKEAEQIVQKVIKVIGVFLSKVD